MLLSKGKIGGHKSDLCVCVLGVSHRSGKGDTTTKVIILYTYLSITLCFNALLKYFTGSEPPIMGCPTHNYHT